MVAEDTGGRRVLAPEALSLERWSLNKAGIDRD